MTPILLYIFGAIAIILGIVFAVNLVLDVMKKSQKKIVNINTDNAPHKLSQQLEPSTHVLSPENNKLKSDKQVSSSIRS